MEKNNKFKVVLLTLLGAGIAGFSANRKEELWVDIPLVADDPSPRRPATATETDSSDALINTVPLLMPSEKAASSSLENSGNRKKLGFPFKNKPLRDPFWKVGYFPAGWGKKSAEEDNLGGSVWDAPAAQLQIGGVSRMGGACGGTG